MEDGSWGACNALLGNVEDVLHVRMSVSHNEIEKSPGGW